MAVGQLLDYSCQVEKRFGRTNMGILLPTEPRLSLVSWLRRLEVYLIWKDKSTSGMMPMANLHRLLQSLTALFRKRMILERREVQSAAFQNQLLAAAFFVEILEDFYARRTPTIRADVR
jgi:hypothetical protein